MTHSLGLQNGLHWGPRSCLVSLVVLGTAISIKCRFAEWHCLSVIHRKQVRIQSARLARIEIYTGFSIWLNDIPPSDLQKAVMRSVLSLLRSNQNFGVLIARISLPWEVALNPCMRLCAAVHPTHRWKAMTTRFEDIDISKQSLLPFHPFALFRVLQFLSWAPPPL